MYINTPSRVHWIMKLTSQTERPDERRGRSCCGAPLRHTPVAVVCCPGQELVCAADGGLLQPFPNGPVRGSISDYLEFTITLRDQKGEEKRSQFRGSVRFVSMRGA